MPRPKTLLTALLAAFPGLAWAVGEGPPGPGWPGPPPMMPPPPPPDPFWPLLQMVGVLALVLGVMLGLLYLIKRFLPRSVRRTGLGGQIKILAQHHLSPKSSLVMIKVLDRVLLLGVTEAGISRLARFDQREAERIMSQDQVAPKTGFSKLLGRRIKDQENEP